MMWLLLIALAIWIFVIQARLAAAERQLAALRHHMPASPPAPIADWRTQAAAALVAPAPQAPEPAAPSPARAASYLRPAAPLADVGAGAMPPRPAPEPKPPKPPKPPAVGPNLGEWLSENGLAWLGGGALALGGALLVAYAAQRGFFTPVFRIWAANGLGLAMVAAGEFLRRQTHAPGGRPALAAAAVSGAGAATLYAAIWAAFALYQFIDAAPAAIGLATVSLALLALALIHGQALGLLAILGAYAAPVICNPETWNDVTLDGYLLAIAATGLAVTGRRAWGQCGLATLAALAAWIAHRSAAGDTLGVCLLLVAGPALTVATLIMRPHGADAGSDEATDRIDLMAALPIISLGGAWLIWTLLGVEPGAESLFNQGATGTVLVLLTAVAVRQRLTAPEAMIAPAAGLAIVATTHMASALPGQGAQSSLWLVVPIAATAAGGLMLALTGDRHGRAGIVGAATAALCLTLMRTPLAAEAGGPGMFVVLAGLMLLGAALLARRSTAPAAELVLAAWLGAGAELLGLAIHTGVEVRGEPAAYAALALGLALSSRRLPWRGLAESAALASLVSLLAMLGPAIAGGALAGQLSEREIGLIGAAAAAFQGLTWAALRRDGDVSPPREAVSTVAVITTVITAFLALRRLALADGQGHAALDEFAESALRTLLLLVAGLILSLRGAATPLGRVRGPLLLALGVIHGVAIGVVWLNPWWGPSDSLFGGAGPTIAGPLVLDEIALAYVAPALVLAAAARRFGRDRPPLARVAAGAAMGFLTVWVVTEVRRLFHHPDIRAGDLLYAEGAAQALGVMVLAWLPTVIADRGLGGGGDESGVRASVATARWAAVMISSWLMLLVASPWWGPLSGDFTEPGLFFALSATVIVLTALFARRPGAAEDPLFRRVVPVAAVAEIFALVTLVIRFSFHGAAMRTPLAEASVETWTFSAVWALFGLVVLAAGARFADRPLRWLGLAVLLATTLKVFLFDMATLEGVIRAGSFLALGALLIIGAVAARRLGAVAPRSVARSDPGEAETGR